MDLLYADLFWGPGPDSQGTWRSAPGAGAGAGHAGLGTVAAHGGAGSAQLSAAGRFCTCCGRPAHAGRDATKAPRCGGGDRQRSKFRVDHREQSGCALVQRRTTALTWAAVRSEVLDRASAHSFDAESIK